MDFNIFYRKGISNSKPDTLLRCLEYYPEIGGGRDQQMQTVLSEKHFDMISAISIGGEGMVFCYSVVQLEYLATLLTKWM
jgi:hypothetical protein